MHYQNERNYGCRVSDDWSFRNNKVAVIENEFGDIGIDSDLIIGKNDDIFEMKAEYNVPEELHGCHTTVVGDYLFEGHVPVESVTQVLDEKPSIIGLSVPGMPLGSPGMSGEKRGPLEVYVIASQPTDSPDIYATH